MTRANDTQDLEPDAAQHDEADGPDETFEVELDGQTHTLPAALKGAFLRQADYTRKTQEVAAHRRALEAERAGLAQDREAARGVAADRATLAALDHQLAGFAALDWRALEARDPHRAEAMWASAQHTRALRDQFAHALAHHEAREHVESARTAAAAMAKTGQALRQEIDGWSPELAAKLVDHAQALGVAPEELSQAADPRLWKLLHRSWRAEQANAGEAAANAPAVRPAVTMSGAGAAGGGVRDELGTKEWMRRRNDQLAKAR